MTVVAFSHTGAKMASASGIRAIMDDIAVSTAAAAGGRPWLNLGIGNPAYIPEVAAAWQRLTMAALSENFAEASCRYGPSRGTPELVGAIVAYFRGRYGWDIGAQNVVVGPGSQLLGFIAAALFTGPGPAGGSKLVLPVVPDYTGYQGLVLTPGGIAGIEPVLEPDGGRSFRYQIDFAALERRDDIGMLLLSSPSNPAGRCLEAAEQDRLIALATARDVPLMIDNAYGEPFPCIGSTFVPPAWHPQVINCFTLSKAGLPGERIGFAIGSEAYIGPMVSFLANSALHAAQLAQHTIARALGSGALDTMVASSITPFYAQRRKLAESLLLDSLPASLAWRLHASTGGMFCWLWVDHDWFDDLALYQALKRKRVFVVPGRHFFTSQARPGPSGAHARQCFRLSISAPEAELTDGIGLIGETLAEMG
ncbi:MAG TPA: aminotransferase class I/II-fold pyridoxal phosphate-dependent enzyme [Streptosporangiaceae bacterium]|jgi:valine--pyruvate aminotransferase